MNEGRYRHYAYLLKHFPHEVRPFDRTAYAAMREDARKIKRYSEEAKLLAANDIVTAEDLRHFTENIGTRFKALAYERAKQRNRLRRMHDSTVMQPTKEIIYDLTAQIRAADLAESPQIPRPTPLPTTSSVTARV